MSPRGNAKIYAMTSSDEGLARGQRRVTFVLGTDGTAPDYKWLEANFSGPFTVEEWDGDEWVRVAQAETRADLHELMTRLNEAESPAEE